MSVLRCELCEMTFDTDFHSECAGEETNWDDCPCFNMEE